MSLVTASERDRAQTEALTGNVVYWAGLHRLTVFVKSPGTERETG